MWDEELRIPVSSEAKDYTLRVACYGKEARQEELLGTGKVDIGPILKSGEFDGMLLHSSHYITPIQYI